MIPVFIDLMSDIKSSWFCGEIYTQFLRPYLMPIRFADNAGDDNIVDLWVISLILLIGNVMWNNTPQRMYNVSPLIV